MTHHKTTFWGYVLYLCLCYDIGAAVTYAVQGRNGYAVFYICMATVIAVGMAVISVMRARNHADRIVDDRYFDEHGNRLGDGDMGAWTVGGHEGSNR